MGFKKIFIGEKMPDKNDPQYKERYDKDVEAGRKFARAIKLDKGVSYIQDYATNNRLSFLVIIFVFVFISISFNIYRMSRAYSTFDGHSQTIQRQSQMSHKGHPGDSLNINDLRQ